MSLIRGPSSASHVQDLIKMNRDLRVKIHLIEGGWKNWMREHPDLIETDRKISGCLKRLDRFGKSAIFISKTKYFSRPVWTRLDFSILDSPEVAMLEYILSIRRLKKIQEQDKIKLEHFHHIHLKLAILELF